MPPVLQVDAIDSPANSVGAGGAGYTRRQWAIGVVGTVLIHLWLLFLLSLKWMDPEPTAVPDPFKTFSIELAAPEEEEDQIYTQTNPDVPQNEPDETNRFGARSQQAANEEAPEAIDSENRPATQSDDDIETDQFLRGSLEEPILAAPPTPEPADEQEAEQQAAAQPPSPDAPLLQQINSDDAAQRKEIPLFGSQEDEQDESGIADYDYEKLKEAPTNITELIEGEETEGGVEKALEPVPNVTPNAATPPLVAASNFDGLPSPKPRPKLPRVASGPVRDSRLGVTAIGQVAVDAKGSKFGEYMERLVEAVSLNWDDLVQRSSSVERKSVVKIRFMLRRDGVVTDIEILDGTTARAIGIYMCREAIQRGVPFGPWPTGLVDIFGEEEDVTFTFHYR